MRHEQFEIEVNAIDGTVLIRQDGLLGESGCCVVLAICQIPTFICALKKEVSKSGGDE